MKLDVILKRLANPSVLLSIVAEIGALLMAFNINIDMNMVTGAITTVLSILMLLGLLSNPDTKTRGYSDDFAFCDGCQKDTLHIEVGGQMLCKDCGTPVGGTQETATEETATEEPVAQAVASEAVVSEETATEEATT